MQVTQLKLTHFRNLASLHLKVGTEPLIALIGPNGSGKTSVLESLSLLSPTRGLLGSDAKAQIQTGKKQAGIWAEANDHELGQTIAKGERILQVDGHKKPLEALAQISSVVWLTPVTDFLFTGPPATRRRWLDDITTALIPSHAEATARFRQHRQARLKLLMQGRSDDWLDAEERLTAEWGLTVLKNRLAYLAALAPHLTGLSLQLSGSALEIMDDPNPVAALKGKLERSRDVDARLERTHAGPNTLDVTGTLHLTTAIPLSQASSGQHKRGLLGWLGAHVQLLKQTRHKPPLVLIDEFSAHLDATARQELLALLASTGCQTWLTDIETPALTPSPHIVALGK